MKINSPKIRISSRTEKESTTTNEQNISNNNIGSQTIENSEEIDELRREIKVYFKRFEPFMQDRR